MKICVVSPDKDVRSETFIREHIARLNATAIFGEFPCYEHDGRSVVPLFLRRGLSVVRRASLPFGAGVRRLAVASVTRFLRDHHIDVILAEYGPTAVNLIEPCRRAAVPLAVHFHGFDAYKNDVLAEYAESYPRVFAAAAAVIAVSRDMERQLLRLGVAREKLFYNPCGVDLDAFFATDASQNAPIFIAVGRFIDKKAPHLTLLAFQRAFEACPSARLIYLGDGHLLDACQQMTHALGMSDRISFLGSRDHDEVAALMRQARAFVQHSLVAASGDSEGTPVAVLEAAASALPVISTRHAGVPEAVIHGVTGLLVDEYDVEGMARHIATLAGDAPLAGAMGRKAREHIAANYSMQKSIAMLREILERAAHGA